MDTVRELPCCMHRGGFVRSEQRFCGILWGEGQEAGGGGGVAADELVRGVEQEQGAREDGADGVV